MSNITSLAMPWQKVVRGRHRRTQRLNSWTSSCNNNNSGSDTHISIISHFNVPPEVFSIFQLCAVGSMLFFFNSTLWGVTNQHKTLTGGTRSTSSRASSECVWRPRAKDGLCGPVQVASGMERLDRLAVWRYGVFGLDADCFKWSKKSGFIARI